MKKKNLKAPLRQFNGAEYTVAKIVNGKEVQEPVMISDQIGEVLWTQASAGIQPAEKYQAFKIAQRIATDPEAVDISDEDVDLIKKVCAQVFSPGAYGQIVDLLESK